MIIIAGFTFMGSTEEQLRVLMDADVDVTSYANILVSTGFLVFLYVNVLVALWQGLVNEKPSMVHRRRKSDLEAEVVEEDEEEGSERAGLMGNGNGSRRVKKTEGDGYELGKLEGGEEED